MFRYLKQFWRGEEAATSIEYAFLLSVIIVVAIGAITTVGTVLHDNVFDSSSKLGKAMTGTSS